MSMTLCGRMWSEGAKPGLLEDILVWKILGIKLSHAEPNWHLNGTTAWADTEGTEDRFYNP